MCMCVCVCGWWGNYEFHGPDFFIPLHILLKLRQSQFWKLLTNVPLGLFRWSLLKHIFFQTFYFEQFKEEVDPRHVRHSEGSLLAAILYVNVFTGNTRVFVDARLQKSWPHSCPC